MPETYRFPGYWWGPGGNDLSKPERSLVGLLQQHVLDAQTAALLWALLLRKASLMMVAGMQRGVGKTTTLTALTACLPEEITPVFLRGRYEDFSFEGQIDPAADYLLINEFSDHMPSYLWGQQAARVFRLGAEGYGFAGTMHANSIDDVIGQLVQPPVAVSGDTLAQSLRLVAMQHAFQDNGEVKRRVTSLSWIYPTSLGPDGLGIKSLVAWSPRDDQWTLFSSPQTWEQLAQWANTAAPQFKEEVERRSQYLQQLASGPELDYDQARAALLQFS